jgi:hypothetical protein
MAARYQESIATLGLFFTVLASQHMASEFIGHQPAVDLCSPEELDRESPRQTDLLQPAPERRTLCGVGAAGTLQCRAAGSIPIATLTVRCFVGRALNGLPKKLEEAHG